MRRMIYAFIGVCLAFLSSGCSRSTDVRSDDLPFLVNLDLSVALSDIAVPRSRVSPDAAPANDDEKMQTLRIVVVRPDGTVEANRFIKPSAALVFDHMERFKVRGREKKNVYLFVNEGNTFVEKADGTSVVPGGKLSEYLTALEEGAPFPTDEVASLVVRLEGDSAQLSGALPMNERHEIEVGEKDCTFELFVTRAAVKFTYRLTNQGDRDLVLTGLTIDKMARKEYYLPHGAVYEENEDGIREIVQYDAVPADYYTFVYADEAIPDVGIALPHGKTVELPAIYLLEGKSADPYATTLSINGIEQRKTFPVLPQLPRNTHVVVNARIRRENATVEWQVDVVPYGLVPSPYDEEELSPGFGI